MAVVEDWDSGLPEPSQTGAGTGTYGRELAPPAGDCAMDQTGLTGEECRFADERAPDL
ncbi:hypothetical protein GCM10027030_12580 [Luteococcus sediminum]